MLDAYHGVIDSLEEIEYLGIDEYYDGWHRGGLRRSPCTGAPISARRPLSNERTTVRENGTCQRRMCSSGTRPPMTV